MKCILLCLLVIGYGSSVAAERYIILPTPDFELTIDGVFKVPIHFAEVSDDDVIYLTHWNSSPSAEIKAGQSTLHIRRTQETFQPVTLKYGTDVKTLMFKVQGQPAHYHTSYQQIQKGKVTAAIPEVYELTNIILALADQFHGTQHRMHAKGKYHEAVISWFSPFKDHPVFDALKHVNYYPFVENGPAYQFEGNRISTSMVYDGFRAQDELLNNIGLVQDFAKRSRFQDFYSQQRAYYAMLIDQFYTDVKPKQIWQWLESEFPQRYDSYKVFFSPLTPGNHSARLFEDNGFKEAIMFVSGPNRYQRNGAPVPLQVMKLTRSFFTEIDHAYVNPVSDKYVTQIDATLTELSDWYTGSGYSEPYLTFNEYMTWSVFSIYAMKTYAPPDYLLIKAHIKDFMENRRGFCRFGAFNDALTALYTSKQTEQKIVDLYPAILDWMKRQKHQPSCET